MEPAKIGDKVTWLEISYRGSVVTGIKERIGEIVNFRGNNAIVIGGGTVANVAMADLRSVKEPRRLTELVKEKGWTKFNKDNQRV